MGVHGLWELLSPVGHRVSNEHVRNKVLAVDVSIWLTQFVKAMRDAEGAQVRNAHLLGVFRRCIKLLFLSVRPVLIFDGATPALKRRTLASRRAQRERHAAKLRRLAEKMLVNQMRQQLIGVAIKKRGTSRPPLPPPSTQNESGEHGEDGPKHFDDDSEDEDKIQPAVPKGVHRLKKPIKKRQQELSQSRGDRAEDESDDEDRIEPVSRENTTPPKSGLDTSADQLKDDELFAADLADEEEQLTRDRDTEPISLPEDLYDLDDEAVGSLPPNVQSEVFKQIKLHQRAKHRERMMLRQRDPSEFSKTQIEGFLQFTALNRKISSVRKAINSKAGASQRIASDSGRRFVLDEGPAGYSGVLDGSDKEEGDILPGRRMGSSAIQDAPTDILARIRANRDKSEKRTEAKRERVRETKRLESESRSGVGWASRVLEGQGGLALGGKSALLASVREESDGSLDSSQLDSESGNGYIRKPGDKRDGPDPKKSDEDDEDDVEWEDGAVDQTVSPWDIGFDVSERRRANAETERLPVAVAMHDGQRLADEGEHDKDLGDVDEVKNVEVALLDIDDVGSSDGEGPSGAMWKSTKEKSANGELDSNAIDRNDRADTAASVQVDSKEIGVTEKSQPVPAFSPVKRQIPDFDDDDDDGDHDDDNTSHRNELYRAQLVSQKHKRESDKNERESTVYRPRPEISSIGTGSKPLTNADVVGARERNVTLDHVSPTFELSQSKAQRKRKSNKEEDRDIQMAIALSMKRADSGIESDSTPSPPKRNGEGGLLALDDQSSEQELLPSGAPGSQSPVASPHRAKSVQKFSGRGLRQEESASLNLPSQNPGSETDKSASDYNDTEPMLPDSTEGETGGNVVDGESRHFEAADMSTERMKELRDELNVEAHEIQRQKNSEQGAAASVSDEMYAETRDLLKLFGIPYLEAPTEAEAQCAFLDMKKLVDGVITEDSDAFLFGAKIVYRRLFSEGRFAEAYEAIDIKNNLGLDRELLIRLAYLLGSDYTSGVRGVGVVNSMEILEAFPGETGLEEFREWMKRVSVFDEEPGESIMEGTSQDAVRRRFCWKHRNMKRNWEMREGFPNSTVVEAYRKPHVDESTEKFKWGKVDFRGLARFCWDKFGWEQDRFNDAVGPLRKKLKEDSGLQQRTIDEFFKPHRFAKIRSERLQTAVRGMAGEDAKELMAMVGRKAKRRKVAPITHLPTVLSDEEDAMVEALDKAEKERENRENRGRGSK